MAVVKVGSTGAAPSAITGNPGQEEKKRQSSYDGCRILLFYEGREQMNPVGAYSGKGRSCVSGANGRIANPRR